MIDDLKLSFLVITFFLLVDKAARLYGLNMWRGIADKYGAKPLLIVSSTVTSMVPLFFIFISSKNYFLILPIFMISAISYAAVDIATSQIMFKSAPRRYDAYYLSAFTSLTGITSALGPIIGGFLAVLMQNQEQIKLLNLFVPLKVVFLISFILRVLCIPLIYKIHEPKARNVNDILERMKTLRTASLFVNIYCFAENASKLVLVSQKQFFILQRKTAELTKKNIVKTLKLAENLSTSLNRMKTIKEHHIKKAGEIKQKIVENLKEIEYIQDEESKQISKNILSKTKAIESCKGGICTNTQLKEKVEKLKKSIEKNQKKLEKTFEKAE